MNQDIWHHIEERLARYVEQCRAQGPPVTEGEIEAAAAAVGVPFPADYREFLLRLGSGALGPYHVYGLRPVEAMGDEWSVIERNQYWRGEQWPGINDWLIISMDGYGNPIGITPDGAVRVSAHDAGFEAIPLGKTFEDFLRRQCLELPS